jgi:hypothetical protein
MSKLVVMYGHETWPMTENNKTMLDSWEKKTLMKVYESVTEQGIWRIRANQEPKELYKTPDLVADIKR